MGCLGIYPPPVENRFFKMTKNHSVYKAWFLCYRKTKTDSILRKNVKKAVLLLFVLKYIQDMNMKLSILTNLKKGWKRYIQIIKRLKMIGLAEVM